MNHPAVARRSVRFWKVIRVVTKVAMFLCIAAAAFLISRGSQDQAAPVLPETAEQFSLDMRVVGSADIDTIYAVEQRARPAYRIFAFDPLTGQENTVFTVPDNAIVYGIALSPDRQSLAVAYAPDFALGGSGLWQLDLDTLSFDEVVPVVPDIYLTDPEFSSDQQSIYVTHVDRQEPIEQLSIAQVSVRERTLDVIASNGITPAVAGTDLYYLAVDAERARREIRVRNDVGIETTIAIGDGAFDLDHLIGHDSLDSLYVAVIDTADAPAVTLGEAAEAHGDHNVASSWWVVGSDPAATPVEPIITYDASMSSDGVIVYATLEGLAVAQHERIELIASRAIRFVAS